MYYLLNASTVFAQKHWMDSLEVWQENRNIKEICKTADQLAKGAIRLTSACDASTFYVAASKAAVDLFEPTRSLQYAHLAKDKAGKCRDSVLLMQAIMQEAVGFNLLSKMDSAVLLTEQVIDYGKSSRNEALLISAYTNLGMMLNKTKAYKEAREAYLQTLALAQKQPLDRRWATAFLNLALTHLFLKEYPAGLAYADSAILYSRKVNVPPLMAHAYGIKSEFYSALGDRARWATTLDTAAQISIAQGNMIQAAYAFLDKFEYFLKAKQYDTAIQEGTRALDILEGTDQYNLIKKAYNHFYQVYKNTGDYPKALAYLEKHTALKDSLSNADFEAQVRELNLKYEVAEKDKTLLQQRVALKDSRFWLVVSIFGILIFFVLAFVYFWRNKLHKETISKLFQKDLEQQREINWLRSLVPVYADSTDESEKVHAQEEAETLSAQLLFRAQELMVKEKLYLNPELTRMDLVPLLGTNRNYLSQAINEMGEGGFRGFINKYRIEHAKKMLWDLATGKSQLPLAEIWQHCGFNSNQTMYRIFKTATGMTPKEYLDQVEEEVKRSARNA